MLPRLFGGLQLMKNCGLAQGGNPSLQSWNLRNVLFHRFTWSFSQTLGTRSITSLWWKSSYTSWSLASQSSSANVTNVGGFPLLNVDERVKYNNRIYSNQIIWYNMVEYYRALATRTPLKMWQPERIHLLLACPWDTNSSIKCSFSRPSAGPLCTIPGGYTLMTPHIYNYIYISSYDIYTSYDILYIYI